MNTRVNIQLIYHWLVSSSCWNVGENTFRSSCAGFIPSSLGQKPVEKILNRHGTNSGAMRLERNIAYGSRNMWVESGRHCKKVGGVKLNLPLEDLHIYI